MRRLKDAAVERNWDEAELLLRDALAQDNAQEQVNVHVYAAVVSVAAQCRNWTGALEVLQQVTQVLEYLIFGM